MEYKKKSKFSIHQHYYLKNGQEVVGVTTVLSQLNKPALLSWVYRLTSQGIKYGDVVNKSKNIGTISHYMIECYLKNVNTNKEYLKDFSQNEIDGATNSFNLFKQWIELHDIKVVYTEHQMVSEKYHYGGTVDAVVYVDNVLCIIDVKTGSGVYDEVKYQISAYLQLYNETNNTDIQQCLIIHIPYEKHNFTEYIFKKDELMVAFEGFIHLLRFYEINKKVIKQ